MRAANENENDENAAFYEWINQDLIEISEVSMAEVSESWWDDDVEGSDGYEIFQWRFVRMLEENLMWKCTNYKWNF